MHFILQYIYIYIYTSTKTFSNNVDGYRDSSAKTIETITLQNFRCYNLRLSGLKAKTGQN